MLRRRVRVGSIPAPDGRIRDHEVHADVVGLERQVLDDEQLDADADPQGMRQSRQEAVVHAASASESAARRTERDARHYDDVDPGEVDRRTGRLTHAELPDDQRVTRLVGHRDELIALDPREEHAEPGRGCVEQGGEVDLVGIRRVEEERALRRRARVRRQLGEAAEVRDGAARCGGDGGCRERATCGQQLAATGVLGPHVGPDVGPGVLGARHAASVGGGGRTDPDLPERRRGPQYARAESARRCSHHAAAAL